MANPSEHAERSGSALARRFVAEGDIEDGRLAEYREVADFAAPMRQLRE